MEISGDASSRQNEQEVQILLDKGLVCLNKIKEACLHRVK